jgi:hypothetical protein
MMCGSSAEAVRIEISLDGVIGGCARPQIEPASQNASIDERLNARLTAPLPPAAPPVSGLRRRFISFFGDGPGETEEPAAPAAIDLSDGENAAGARPPAPAVQPQQRTQCQRRSAAFGTAGGDAAREPAAEGGEGGTRPVARATAKQYRIKIMSLAPV